MSRAFVKEDSGESGEPVKRQASGRPNYVTPAGLAALKARAAELLALKEKLLASQRPDEPRSMELRQAEADLDYYESQLKGSILVDNRGLKADEVRFGARVRVREAGGLEKEYALVGEDESDPPSGKINWGSPLGSALLGARAGAMVSVERRGGPARLEIISVSYPAE